MKGIELDSNNSVKKYRSKVFFFDDLIIKKEEETNNIYLGRTRIDKYVIIPEIGENIISLLLEGHTIEEVFYKMNSKHQDIEPSDIVDFIMELSDLNFIKKAFDKEYETIIDKSDYGINIIMNNNILSKLIFNKFCGILFVIIILVTLIFQLFINKYSILPSYKEYFWSESLLLVVLITPVFDIITGLAHEFFHFLASNLFEETSAKFSLSHRLLNLVYQTRIKNIWLVPKNNRYLIYCAGMMIDILIICIFMWCTFIFNHDSTIFKFSRFAILYLEFGVIFQFKFYMKTDVYYFLSDFFNKPNLFDDSLMLVKKRFLLIDKSDSVDYITVLFGVFILCGSIIDVFITLNYIVPSIKYYLYNLFNGNFNVGSIISLVFFVVYYSIIGYSIMKEKMSI
ncbi:hypothetical protein [Lagierella sp.]|uniref:hypothetical protein n=1 Tax=Lagierella sp. TaxID=2849657 RepID=UPI00261D7041|nr:hypothetical protein [Lagierella sp.]